MTTPQELLVKSVEAVKEAYRLSKVREENADITSSLMGLREDLQVIRESVLDLVESNQKLSARVTELQSTLELQPQLSRQSGLYWKEGDPEPWCPQCWEADHRALHLNQTTVLAGRLRTCPGCNYDINMDNVELPKKKKK